MTAEQLSQWIGLFASITLFEMMVTIGLGATFAEVWSVAAQWRLVGKAALANYVCVPAAAIGLLILFQSNPYVAAGFLVAAVCPGAPYGPRLTMNARGDVIAAVGLMVILAGSSALVAPLLLDVALRIVLDFLPPLPPDSALLAINGGRIATILLISQFIPLCLGLSLRQWRPALAERLKRPANVLNQLLGLTLLTLIIFAEYERLISVPLRGYVGMLILLLASLLAGWFLGGPARGTRIAMALATSARNVGVVMVIAASSFTGTPAVTAAIVFAVFQTVALVLFALVWGKLVSTSPAVNNAMTGTPL